MELISQRVGTAFDGERADRTVAIVAGVSRSVAARLVAQGSVTVDGEVVRRGAQRLQAESSLSIRIRSTTPQVLSADPTVTFEQVFVDDHVVVVNKPAGLIVHPGAGAPTGTLANGLLARFPNIASVGDESRPGIVHRLDKGTSGLLVVARSQTAYESLCTQLKQRSVLREYCCLAWRHLQAPTGMIDAPVGRSKRNPIRMTVTRRGRDARTRYEVHTRFRQPAPATLLRCRLETGRTHQIRVHLSAISHPVVGDPTYTAGASTPASALSRLRCQRPFLHAARLHFVHPVSGAPMKFRARLPDDLREVLSMFLT